MKLLMVLLALSLAACGTEIPRPHYPDPSPSPTPPPPTLAFYYACGMGFISTHGFVRNEQANADHQNPIIPNGSYTIAITYMSCTYLVLDGVVTQTTPNQYQAAL